MKLLSKSKQATRGRKSVETPVELESWSYELLSLHNELGDLLSKAGISVKAYDRLVSPKISDWVEDWGRTDDEQTHLKLKGNIEREARKCLTVVEDLIPHFGGVVKANLDQIADAYFTMLN